MNRTSNSDLFGSTNAKTESNGVFAQFDDTPWGNGKSPLGPHFNMRVRLQYTACGKFDGAKQNYCGTGINASDNNDLETFTWIAF